MNKQLFMKELQKQLAPLSAVERKELLSEYEDHFVFGLQNGRTEEEIVRELGDPVELAKEALGDRYIHANQSSSVGTESSRTIFSIIMLFFVNLVMLPLGISFWAVVFSLGVSGVASILSPLLIPVDFMFSHSFSLSKVFMSISLMGVGILLSIGTYYTAMGLWKLTSSYLKWNVNTVKGSK